MTRDDWAVVVVTFGPLCLAAAYIGILRLERRLNEIYRREDRARAMEGERQGLPQGVFPET